jgi:gamma-glutamylcyclotransferase (GGCT)/AIG2-like uncharacterized protein YtfP
LGRWQVAWPRRLFFYGTLSHEHNHPLTAHLAGPTQRGWVRGRLRLIADPGGVYPVLKPGAGRVWGWVYGHLRPIPPRTLAALDKWEGFDPRRPKRGEYCRTNVIVQTRGGPLRAQAYLPNHHAHPGQTPVPGGDFAAHVAARALRIYAD